MTQPRLPLRSQSGRRLNLVSRALGLEPLEARRLMCSLHDATLERALEEASRRQARAGSRDHDASWYVPVGQQALRGASGDDAPGAAPTYNVNAAGLPLLTSRADGQGLKVFLDFDGNGGNLPFSTDADTTTFNAAEQLNIYQTWRDIVSFYSALDVNVTTIQPPTGGTNPDFAWQLTSNSISGGYAYVGWIDNAAPHGFTGSDNAVNRHSGLAHEIGHLLGLSHQSEYSVDAVKDEYTDGLGSRDRAIIGVDFAENVRGWFYGRDSDSALNLQDDLATMTNTIKSRVGGDGYRPDDVAGTLAGATAVPAGGMIAGYTERLDDADVFRFTSTGGTYQIAATPTYESAASPKLELLDSAGNLVAARDDADRRNTNNNAQEFDLDLAAGTYYARVSSSGDYGELGEYLLTAAPLPTGWTSQDVGAATIYRGGTAAFDATANTLTQLGGGTDIFGTADEFRFTSTTLAGDGAITARINALDNVDSNAKAGVMIRATNAANSAMAYVGIKPSGQLDPIVRGSAGAAATVVGNPNGVTAPWVRLTRAGNLFTFERSADGIAWATYGTVTVAMGSAVLIGFATNSRSPRQQAYASFSNIAVSGTLGNAAPTYNALPAPASLAAVPVAGANTSVSLAWAAASGAAGYAIERSVDGVTYALLATLGSGGLTYTDVNPFGSMRYFYRVSTTATDNTRSTPSPVASVINKPNATVNPNASYAKPVIVYSSTQLLLNWTDVQGDNGYRVERSTAGGAYVVIATTPRNYNAYNDSGLTPYTAYSYRVTPLTSVGDGIAGSWTTSATTPLAAAANFRIATRTPTSFTLAWGDLASETGYRLERSTDASTWSTLANLAANATSYVDSTGLTSLTRYYYRLRATDPLGKYGDPASAFGATPAAGVAAPALPAGWSGVDVGAPAGVGTSAGATGGAWTVIGAGADIWGSADQFQYANRGVTGNGSIVARLTNLDNTDYYVKAGVMFRESTAANSPYVFMHYSSGPGLQFEFRDAAGASSGNGFVLTSTARWLRLARTGNLFTAAYSADGVTWTTAASRTVTMASVATMGLAATSHNVDRLTLATFENVAVTGAVINAAPTITSAAAANPTPVTGSTAALTVGATDDGGAANLSYLWSTLTKPAGVADPTFSVNNGNIASSTAVTFAAAGNYTLRVTVRDAQGLTTTSDVAVTVNLRAFGGTYRYDAAQPQLTVQFNGNVAATLAPADLVLVNQTTGATIPATAIVSSFNTATNTATFTFTAGPNGTLPDGNYRATINANSVAEPSGVTLAMNAITDFFVLAGDTNRDATIDFADLLVLAQNYGQAGRIFSQGNVNYDVDGLVDFGDLLVLAQRYGQSLQLQAAATVNATTTKRPGVRADVLAIQ